MAMSKITLIQTDTCLASDAINYFEDMRLARAVAPNRAGREGISLGSSEFHAILLLNDSYFTTDKEKVSFGFKFYIKFHPNSEETKIFTCKGLGLTQMSNGSLRLNYNLAENGTTTEQRYVLEIPEHDFPADSELIQSESIQLNGMKLTVLRHVDQDEDPSWMMVGIDYDRKTHFNVYINGKNVHTLKMTETKYVSLFFEANSSGPEMKSVSVSCMEFSPSAQSVIYYEDPSLNECSKFFIYEKI